MIEPSSNGFLVTQKLSILTSGEKLLTSTVFYAIINAIAFSFGIKRFKNPRKAKNITSHPKMSQLNSTLNSNMTIQ